MTNPNLFNGDVRHDVSGGPVCNPRDSPPSRVTLAHSPNSNPNLKVHDDVSVGLSNWDFR